ncbi:phosphocholine-specific phospholipase C [Cupriavidus sp. IDO]|uniref:phosphocholine-specific phospholipase C n=1 Tax=Cupriavidus sp. IDO TaxID=1539142 RepID=UPI0005797702|nr:phospholipase C, phosphocholine-specific [Cupriavidus sp. IDO]KWR76538.1 phospholipase C, phosphocholine-specific [Cupriavidus sp. IDO]
MNSNSRRSFLKLAGSSAAATAALAAFPPAIRRALAIPANNATGTIRDVEHVVILMQENRSFDHYFGTLKGVRGFGDRFPIPLAGGLNVWQQTYINGTTTRTVLPYHLDSTVGNAQRVNGTPHSYPDAQNAWDLGRMNKWPTYKNTQSMGFYTEAELDFQFALANAFTICDAYHCGFHGGTNTNRLFHWTGTNDPTGANGGPSIDNSGDSFTGSNTPYTWTTYPERLQSAGVSWKVYQNMPDNYTDNPLAGFKQYRDANAARGNLPNGSPYPPYAPSDEAISPLLKGIANTMPDSGFLQALRDDMAAGKLPQVSWIVGPATYSEHPGPSSPVQGAWYTQEVLNALTANPDIWSKTVLIINFDENDGFFDHVPPPCAPAYDNGTLAGASTVSTAGEYHTDQHPYGPGPRVPMYVVSPWSRGGWVNSQVFDHTSVLRFIEARFGVAETNISGYRRAVVGDLTTAFNFVNPNSASLPALPSRDKAGADAIRTAQGVLPQVPLPSTSAQQMPAQAKGARPSRALPYELHVSAREDAASRVAWLLFSNTGKAAAVFHVYDRLHLDRVPRRYVVEPGKELHGSWDVFAADGGKYDLWVLGPNGFHRAFSGDVSKVTVAGASAPEIRVCYDVANAAVYLTLINTGSAPCTFTVQPNAYRTDGPWLYEIPAGKQLEQHWPVGLQGNWYDFSVTTAQGGFTRRFAGRIETGADSVSDPAMGATS